jgi:hypothetical protein
MIPFWHNYALGVPRLVTGEDDVGISIHLVIAGISRCEVYRGTVGPKWYAVIVGNYNPHCPSWVILVWVIIYDHTIVSDLIGVEQGMVKAIPKVQYFVEY